VKRVDASGRDGGRVVWRRVGRIVDGLRKRLNECPPGLEEMQEGILDV
jgi:hypothetical protein